MASLQRFMGLGKSPAYDSALACYEEERYSDAIPLFETALRECHDPTVQKLARAYLAESYAKLGYRRHQSGRLGARLRLLHDGNRLRAPVRRLVVPSRLRRLSPGAVRERPTRAATGDPSEPQFRAGTVPDGTDAVRPRRARAGADHLTAVGSATGRHPRDIR
jgi:hypothetical protein